MSTATARVYQPYFAGWFMPFEVRKSPQNKAFYGHRGTYLGKAHCIKDRVLLDPCSGSGHILAYMFDVLMKIYESCGYTTREAVASIVKNNLYGLDIDERAAQLAYFAVMMKARQYDRRFFSRGIQPHVYAIIESNHVDKFAVDYFCNGDTKLTAAMDTIIGELYDAKEYGSILTVTPQDWSVLYDRFAEIMEDINMSRETATMQVASLEDGRIDENMLALSIGLATTGLYGLARAVNSEQWYRNIILHDSLYSCEQLLEFVYPELAKQNSWKLPVWYYISKSDMKSELAEEKAPHLYTEIVTESTIKRNHSAIGERTAWEVWTQEKDNLMKAIRLLGCMSEEKIDVNQYRSILEAIFTENNNILSSLDSPNRSNLHRMIRIYDFLEYGQKKTP